ncbi:RuvC-like resolvase [Mycobacterium phage OrangeOswald]|nr:RuvC-like resolvase [Mycobacterium phage OrangeOswald]
MIGKTWLPIHKAPGPSARQPWYCRHMTRVLSVDPSLTSTGLCRVDLLGDTEPVRAEILLHAVKSKPTADKSYAAMSRRIEKIAGTVRAAMDGCDLIVIEGPSFGSKGQHTHSRDWLWGKIFDAARVNWGIPVLVVTPSQRMKYATGKGNAQKDAVLAAAIKRWPDVEIDGNDQADALILAAIGCRSLGCPIDAVPASHFEPVMAKLAA